MRFTFKNSFHNTAATILIPFVPKEHQSQNEVWNELQNMAHDKQFSMATIRRVRRRLCGMFDCTCGTVR